MRKMILGLALTLSVFMGLSFLNHIIVSAEPGDMSLEDYPFVQGENGFAGGKEWVGPATVTDSSWETLYMNFTSPVDLTSAQYLAIQFSADMGAPGLTIGVESSGTRYSTVSDGDEIFFMDEATGIIESLGTVLYSSINVPQGKVGLILVPMSALHYQFGDAGNTLSTINNVILTTNTLYNYNWSLSVNSVGFFDGEVEDSNTTFTEISLEYIANVGSYTSLNTIEVQAQTSLPDSITYPFRTGELAFENGRTWVGAPTASTEADWQTLFIEFDEFVDLSNASFLAIQFANTSGSPGLTFGIESTSGRYSVAGIVDGEPIYVIAEDGTISLATNTLYGAVTTSVVAGTLLIPMTSMGWQFNPNGDDLSSIGKLVVTTNRMYNYNYQVTFGEIGYYEGELTELSEITKLLDLSESKVNQFSLVGDITQEGSLINPIERFVYGDTYINITGTGRTADSFGVWSGGSFGTISMLEDSYGDQAMQLMASGTNPEGDTYTAIDISQGGFSWAGQEGVTFWARNDSDGEISFNLEIDNKIVETEVSDRFNIAQGHRYYLYDINTDKTYIYMTKPTVNLPVGFEGWVRIPFSAFTRASWSNNGVTDQQFMSEGTIISYLAVTIHSGNYINMAFSINKIGSYSTIPGYISPFIPASESNKSILDLMELQEEDN